jgi:hypothetical protein
MANECTHKFAQHRLPVTVADAVADDVAERSEMLVAGCLQLLQPLLKPMLLLLLLPLLLQSLPEMLRLLLLLVLLLLLPL